jgi:hypothetical protein
MPEATYQYVPLRTFQFELFPLNQAELSSTAKVSECRYAARRAEDDASTPELEYNRNLAELGRIRFNASYQ